MKKILFTAIMSVFVLNSYAEVEKKKVCHMEIKNNKKVEVCKTIKVHKKLEGTKVPEKKK